MATLSEWKTEVKTHVRPDRAERIHRALTIRGDIAVTACGRAVHVNDAARKAPYVTCGTCGRKPCAADREVNIEEILRINGRA